MRCQPAWRVAVCAWFLTGMWSPSTGRAADSAYLYGIHWWGYTYGYGVDNGPCQMLDCLNLGGWDVETVITNGNSIANWWKADWFVPLYTDLYNNKNVTPITVISYDWGQTVPAPSNPDSATWPSAVVATVNKLANACHIWVIGNEPNYTENGNGWPSNHITPSGYATAYRNVRNAIKSQASSSPAGTHRVLIAAPSPGVAAGYRWMGSSDWLGQVIDNIPAAEIDGFAMHAFGSVADFHQSYTSQLAVIDGRGHKQAPVYITQWNVASTEPIMAQAIRDGYADVHAWNQVNGHHNIIALCWFIYDADQQAAGNPSLTAVSLEYWRSNGLPVGNTSDPFTAFQQTVALRYPAGKVGTPGLSTMTRSPASFTRSINAEENLPNDTFTIQRTAGPLPVDYTITDDVDWLSVSPGSGTTTGEIDTLTISYATTLLAPGTYSGTIRIAAENAANSPLTITVNLTVNPSLYAQADFDRDGDVDQEDFGRFQVCYSGTGVSPSDPNCLKARLNFGTIVDLEDFTLFQRCVSGPNVPADLGCLNP